MDKISKMTQVLNHHPDWNNRGSDKILQTVEELENLPDFIIDILFGESFKYMKL